MRRSNQFNILTPRMIAEIDTAYEQVIGLYPEVDVAKAKQFVDRKLAHVSLPFRADPRFWMLALQHAAKKGDPAYSTHGSYHAVYTEALENLAQLMKKKPAAVQLSVQPQQARFGEHELTANRLIISSVGQERALTMPTWFAVGQELQMYLKGVAPSEGVHKTIFKNIQKATNLGFAVLAYMTAGFRYKDITAFSTNSFTRPMSAACSTATESLYAGGKYPVFVRDNQLQSGRAIGACKEFGSSPLELTTVSTRSLPTEYKAIFASLGEKFIQLVEPRLKREHAEIAQKQVYQDKFDSLFTTQVITAYNVYSIARPTNFTDFGSVQRLVTSLT